jgi:hypothetical protein
VYLGGRNHLFFRSTDQGRTWDTITNGLGAGSLETTIVTDISITSTHMVLGSSTRWVWIRPLSEVLPPASIDNIASPYAIRLEQNAPNPVSSAGSISYTLTAPGYITLKLYDAASREVATLVDERREAGDHAVHVEVGGLPAGIYFYRLTSEGSSLLRRMIVVK